MSCDNNCWYSNALLATEAHASNNSVLCGTSLATLDCCHPARLRKGSNQLVHLFLRLLLAPKLPDPEM